MSANHFVYQPVAGFVDAVAAVAEQFGVRGLERRTGINKATISRVQNGREFDLATAQALGFVVGVCPCCGKKLPRRRMSKP